MCSGEGPCSAPSLCDTCRYPKHGYFHCREATKQYVRLTNVPRFRVYSLLVALRAVRWGAGRLRRRYWILATGYGVR